MNDVTKYPDEIECALLEGPISITDCSLTVDVCEGFFKKTVLRRGEVLEVPNWKEKCRGCKYHNLEYV